MIHRLLSWRMDPLAVTLVLLLVVVVWRLSIKSRFRVLVDTLPGPPAYPIIGNLLDILVPKEEFVEMIQTRQRKYGPILRTWLGPLPGIHIAGPEYIETVLSSNKHINKGRAYRFLHPWLGRGLLTSTGQQWFNHRKLITPTFHFKILDNFVSIFQENSDILVERLEEKANTGEEFDVYPYMSLCTLDIICETAMGTKVYAQGKSQSAYVNAIYRLSQLTMERGFRLWLYPDFIYYNTKRGKEYKKHLSIAHGFTKGVIEDRKKWRMQRKDTSVKEDDVGSKKKQAFLDLLLDAAGDEEWNKLSDVELREEVDTFMFEGHDTTTAGISWALFMLGHHPKIQEDVYEELQAMFQDDPSRPVTMRDLGDMKVLERVIKETLRLFPSVPFVSRSLEEDLQLGAYTIPRGVTLVLHILNLHRNPALFPDPHVFNPDRFLPENTQDRDPYAYVPFSAGPRNCIGQKFALLEEKAILSTILRRYKVQSTMDREDVTLISDLVLKPDAGIKLKISKRK